MDDETCWTLISFEKPKDAGEVKASPAPIIPRKRGKKRKQTDANHPSE